MSIEIIDIAIRIGLVAATAFLFAIVFMAYMRLKNRKLLFISAGFGIFFIHALIYIPELFWGHIYGIDENTHLVIHLIALVLILVGTMKD